MKSTASRFTRLFGTQVGKHGHEPADCFPSQACLLLHQKVSRSRWSSFLLYTLCLRRMADKIEKKLKVGNSASAGTRGYLRAGVTSWPLPALSWPLCLHMVLTAVLLEQSGAYLLEPPPSPPGKACFPPHVPSAPWPACGDVTSQSSGDAENTVIEHVETARRLYFIFVHDTIYSFFSIILPLFISNFVVLFLLRLGTTWT